MTFLFTGDGILKGSCTVKSVFPIAVKIESAPPQYRVPLMSLLFKGSYANIDIYLLHLVRELIIASREGLMIMINGRLTRVRICVIGVGGDLRALPGMIGKYQDPAHLYACLYCVREGVALGRGRTIYYDTLGPAPAYTSSCPENEPFKRTPILGAAIPDLVSKLMSCSAHTLKNFCIRLMQMHSNVGKAKWTENLLYLEREIEPNKFHAVFPDEVPWKASTQHITLFETRILNSHFGSNDKPKSPFQRAPGTSPSDLRKKEIFPGNDASTFVFCV